MTDYRVASEVATVGTRLHAVTQALTRQAEATEKQNELLEDILHVMARHWAIQLPE